MKTLLMKKFHFQNAKIITEQTIGANVITFDILNSKLNDIAARIQINKNVDGLIMIYSWHGSGDSIVCGDREFMTIQEIQQKFAANKLAHLHGRPKLLYIDACWGEQEIEEKEMIKLNQKDQRKLTSINLVISLYIMRLHHIKEHFH